MAEYLLESGKGGAVAAVAYNPCGVNGTSQILFKEALNRVFHGGEICLGRAVFAAKCSVIARYPTNDNLYGPAVLWTLFGDPALRIKYRALSGTAESPAVNGPALELAVRPSVARGVRSIRFGIPDAGPVSLRLYDETGTLKATLVSGRKERGEYRARVPDGLEAGSYLLRLVTNRLAATARFVVLR